MKTLHLLRHAKSSWSQPGLADRKRGLNKRGLRDAPLMGAALSTLIEPQQIITNTASRARLTLEGLCDGWPALTDVQHTVEEDLYTFSSRDLIDYLSTRAEAESSLFLIGHNPAFTGVINWLTGCASVDNLPTAGYARLLLAVDRWLDLSAGCATLEFTVFPKDLRPS